MKLKEFESKDVLNAAGIETPNHILIRGKEDIPYLNGEYIIKVQTCEGKRGKAGGVRIIRTKEEAYSFSEKFLGKEFRKETVYEILLAKRTDTIKELFAGIMFDTSLRGPVIIFSEEGGVDIEELKERKPEKIITREIDYLKGLTEEDAEKFLEGIALQKDVKNKIKGFLQKLYSCFVKFDCKMIEINPLAITRDNELAVLDASVILDENADYRREIKFPERTGLRKATESEIAAKQIDKEDYRGVAGKTYIDMDGDIGIMASGGGASITLMDALQRFGGKAANYTEYSGNPPKEKVEKLARIVMEKKGISGMLVAGVIANFTDIAETIMGFTNALIEVKPDYPIVVRRAGPNDKEARDILMKAKEEFGLDIHYFDENVPLTKAAEIIVELAGKYKENRKNLA